MSHFNPHWELAIILPDPRSWLVSQSSLWENKPWKHLTQPVLHTNVWKNFCHWLTFLWTQFCVNVYSVRLWKWSKCFLPERDDSEEKDPDRPKQIWYVIIFIQSSLNGTCTVSGVTLYRWWRPVYPTSRRVYRRCRTGKDSFSLFIVVVTLTSTSVFSHFFISRLLEIIPCTQCLPLLREHNSH